MRWLPFAGCALFVLVLQTALAPRIELFGVRPDWLLALIVVTALCADGFEIVVAAWAIGAVADLSTLDRPGLMSITYCLAALLVYALREAVFRHHGVTQFFVTLVAALFVQVAWALYRWVMLPESAWASAGEIIVAAVYTAAFAPLIGRAVMAMSRLLGLPRRRYGYRGMMRGVRHV